MSQKFSPPSQLALWKQAQIPPDPVFHLPMPCRGGKHFLRNSRTGRVQRSGAQGGEKEDSFFKLEGICSFHTLRKEGPESGGWDCSAPCKGTQRSHCVWYHCCPIGLWQQHQKQQILQCYIWKEAFSFHREGGKTQSWRHWSLMTLYPIVLKISISLIEGDNPMKNGSSTRRTWMFNIFIL